MSDYGQRFRPPQAPNGAHLEVDADPKFGGNSIEADRQYALERFAMFQRREAAARAMRKPAAPAASATKPSQPEAPASGGWRERLKAIASQTDTHERSSAGVPLSGDVRQRMEPLVGADLSAVKVHADGAAAHRANQLGARAFTVGSDIHFNSGQYTPGSKEGDRLLGHELTHVVQGQRSAIARQADDAHAHGPDGVEVSQPGEPAEQEADSVGDHIANQLHGGGEIASSDHLAPKERAPAIGAKLDPAKVHLAGKDPLRGPKKDTLGHGPETNAVHVGNAVQAGVQQPPQHHVFPQAQEHAQWFADRGVNVHDYCVTLPKDHHEALHAKPPKVANPATAKEAAKWEWNNAVMTLLKDAEKARGRRLTVRDMVLLVRPLMTQYGLTGPFEKYKGAAK